MPARDGVAGPAQILRQIHFHLHRRLERHRVQVCKEFRQQPDAVAFDHIRGFDTCLMIGETLHRCQASHADVDARLRGIALRIFRAHFAELAHGRIEQHDVNVVMLARLPSGAKLSERATFH